MNKCPYCDEIIAVPASLPAVVSGVPVLLLSCPYCFKMVGIVKIHARNHPVRGREVWL